MVENVGYHALYQMGQLVEAALEWSCFSLKDALFLVTLCRSDCSLFLLTLACGRSRQTAGAPARVAAGAQGAALGLRRR